MTRDEIVSIIKQRMANNTDSDLDALIVTEMELAQEVLEQEAELPWFLFGKLDVVDSSAATITFTHGGAGNYLSEHPSLPLLTRLSSVTTKHLPMIKDDYVVLLNTHKDTLTVVAPTHYAMTPEVNLADFSYTIFPTPDVDMDYRLYCFVGDVILDSDVENKWLKFTPELMIGYVGKIIAGQYEALQGFVPMFVASETGARNWIMKKNIEWEEANIRRLMGDS